MTNQRIHDKPETKFGETSTAQPVEQFIESTMSEVFGLKGRAKRNPPGPQMIERLDLHLDQQVELSQIMTEQAEQDNTINQARKRLSGSPVVNEVRPIGTITPAETSTNTGPEPKDPTSTLGALDFWNDQAEDIYDSSDGVECRA